MIHQELNPILDMPVYENIFVGREIRKNGLVDKTDADSSTDSFRIAAPMDKTSVLSLSNLTFNGLPPIDFSLDSGEIGLLQDENYRTGGVLFDNLSALENLSTSLIPKAGKHFLHRHLMDSILDEASEWFDKDALLKSISTWSMPERLRLSYFKWYLMNPKVLICLFPFLGQESIYHEMIIDLLVLCARRGIAVWVISSGIHTIREKTRSREFLERVRFLD